ncbi:stage II sporulation protein R [Natroniella acetigena]|uniref:stage II sporulation protein R n=1 Tax=Natroniella acetigena TaxID=52004 RepID=UPI00200A6383|nr:stage II sporulation protein R [Natroniella acetigena]MCK8828280.1 stage II sporulation protein R [Natroniella acetigena]
MKRVRLVVIISIALVLLSLWANSKAFVLVDDYQQEDLLRLHIVPNSNSIDDQILKREIKEQVITMTQTLLADKTDISQAETELINNKEQVGVLIEDELRTKGYDYQVELNITETFFPTRTYGNLTLEQGDYKALEIIIGQGGGENWWCVLFPPLCFIDSGEQVVSESEGEVVDNLDHQEVDFKFKLKSIEYLEENHKWVKERLNSINLANIFRTDN